MEQATRFPRMSSPPRSSNSAEPDASTADFLNSQYSKSSNAPPGFPSANKLVHPAESIFSNLDTLRLSSNVTDEDLSSKASNISAFTPLISAPLASSTGSTVGTPSSSASSPETVASNASSNSGLPTIQKETVRMFDTDPPISTNSMMSSNGLGPSFTYSDFTGLSSHNGGLGQLPLVNVLTSSVAAGAAAEQQKLDLAKKRRDNRNRARLKDRNVLAEHKAEEIEGYEGEKPINDLLESLGEATQEEKKQKTKRAPKEKRERKRKEKLSLPQGGEDEQVEEDEVLQLKEKNNSKKGTGKQLTHTRSNNIDELNQNVFMVQTGSEDERTMLNKNDSLTASSDGLNFVPVTGKKKGKKMKEDNEKSKDYTRKSKEDTGRPPPGGGRDGNIAPIPPGRDGKSSTFGKTGDNRRSSNYHLRSRDVAVSGEGEKKVEEGSSASSRNNSSTQPPTLNEFPALNISQDFPALPTAEQTDKPQHIHSAWVRKPSTGSSSGSPAVPNNNMAVITSTSPPPPPSGVSNTTSHSTTPPPQTDHCDTPTSCTDVTADQDADTVVAVNDDDDGGHVIKSVPVKQNSGDGAHSKSNLKNKPKVKTVKKNASLNAGHFDDISSSSKNNDNINCDKSIVSEEVHINTASPTNINNPPDTNEEKEDVINVNEGDSLNTSPSILKSANPLLCDDLNLICSADYADTSNTDINFTANTEIDEVADESEMGNDDVCTSEQESGQTYEEKEINTIANFEFDTRSNFCADEVTFNDIDQDASEISFGFEVNFELLDSSSAPKDCEKSKTEDDQSKEESNEGRNEELVFGSTERDSIASVDNAILSFRAAHQGMVVSDGYEHGFIPQPFATNYLPNFSQMNEGGEQAKEVEAVSPESGICSPLSWQGEGEESITNNVTSPPLQPGSYPRRQEEGQDIMSQLNNSLKLHLRRSSRSPSPHNSVRSGSAGSSSANQSNTTHNFRNNLEDSGVHTTSRNTNQTSSRDQAQAPNTETDTNNPNYGEIVSFLKIKWNESAKDKQAKVYGGGGGRKK